jgi:TolB protein
VRGFARAVPVGLVSLAAAGPTSADAVHNAEITWGSYDAIRGANVDGSGRHVVARPIADNEGDPAWTRDGRKLALFGSFSDTVRLYVFSPMTRTLHAVGGVDPRAEEPTWSPDAKHIAVRKAWGSVASINAEATIEIVSLATNKWTSVTKPRRHRVDVDPAWSPDGRTIAFARKRDGGTPTIYLAHPDGTALRRLTRGRSPSWSPDGRRLAFALGGSVYEIRTDGRGRKRILGGLHSPLVRWSPDGRKLLYTSGSEFRGDVWTADVDGTHRRRILRRVAIEGIAWRPG